MPRRWLPARGPPERAHPWKAMRVFRSAWSSTLPWTLSLGRCPENRNRAEAQTSDEPYLGHAAAAAAAALVTASNRALAVISACMPKGSQSVRLTDQQKAWALPSELKQSAQPINGF